MTMPTSDQIHTAMRTIGAEVRAATASATQRVAAFIEATAPIIREADWLIRERAREVRAAWNDEDEARGMTLDEMLGRP